MEFKPERFEPEKMKNWHPYQFVPFGGGKRLCLGNLFALTQVKVLLSMILRKFHIRPVPGKDVKIGNTRLTFGEPLHAEEGGGIWLKFFNKSKRKSAIDNIPKLLQSDKISSIGTLMKAQERDNLNDSGMLNMFGMSLEERDLTRFFHNRTQKKMKKNQKKTLKMGQKIKKMSPIIKKSCYFIGEEKISEILVIYASEYGTTRKAATNFTAHLREKFIDNPNTVYKAGLKIHCKGAEEVPINAECELVKNPREALVILFAATYNGHPAAHAEHFLKGFKTAVSKVKKLDEKKNNWNKLSFAVIGFGNSNWVSTYAKMGKTFDKLFADLGSKRFLPYEIVDKNGAHEKTVLQWEKCLFGKLAKRIEIDHQNTINTADMYGNSKSSEEESDYFENSNELTKLTSKNPGNNSSNSSPTGKKDPAEYFKSAPDSFVSFTGNMTVPGSEADQNEAGITKVQTLNELGYKVGVIKRNDELIPQSDETKLKFDKLKSVREINIEIRDNSQTGTELPYECGDHLCVNAVQKEEDIKKFCDRFGFHPDAVIIPQSSRPAELQHKRGQKALGKKVKVKDIIALHVDISAIPSQECLAGLVPFATDLKERQEIVNLTRIEGAGLGTDEDSIADSFVLPAGFVMEGGSTSCGDKNSNRKNGGPKTLEKLSSVADEFEVPKGMSWIEPPKIKQPTPIAYSEWVETKKMSILDCLIHWQSIKGITLSRLIEICPPTEPRLYSIASSPVLSLSKTRMSKENVLANEVSLCLGVVKYEVDRSENAFDDKNQALATKHGLASTYLAEMKSGSPLLCMIKKAPHMRLPRNPETPVIMVCAGTGLAPFLGFLEEREMQICSSGYLMNEMLKNCEIKEENDSKYTASPFPGSARLYFGCRSDYDQLHAEKLDAYHDNGLCEVKTAFSRKYKKDDKKGNKNCYVYHLMEEDTDYIRSFFKIDASENADNSDSPIIRKEASSPQLENNYENLPPGVLYMCGSASTLAKDCAKVLHKILGNGDLEKGEALFDDLISDGRIVMDVWG